MKAKHFKSRHALLMSLTSLMLCVSMLFGATFAWFTDSVTSGVNRIISGNLDVELEYFNPANGGSWIGAAGADAIFIDLAKNDMLSRSSLWEPGHTEVAYLRLRNAGTLALNYQLSVYLASEQKGINAAGDEFKLSDYLYYGITAPSTTQKTYTAAQRAQARTDAGTDHTVSANDVQATGVLLGTEHDWQYVTMIVYMPEETGNIANYKTGTAAPEIGLGVRLLATQQQAEADSFGTNYDAAAEGEFEALPAVSVNSASVVTSLGVTTKNEETNEITYTPSSTDVTISTSDSVATVTLPAALINNLANLKDSEDNAAPVTSAQVVAEGRDETTNTETNNVTVSYTNVDLVDQDGNKINLETMENDVPVPTSVYVGTGILGDITVKLNPGQSNQQTFTTGNNATYDSASGKVSFSVLHFCPMEISYKEYEAVIGETLYETLADALSSAESGDTVTLLKDVTVKSEIDTLPAGVTLEGSSKTISLVGTNYLFHSFYGQLKGTTVNFGTTTAGGIAFISYGGASFTNVKTVGTFTRVGKNHGGFTSYYTGALTFTNCEAAMTVTGTGAEDNYVSPFIGWPYGAKGCTITYDSCVNTGTITCGHVGLLAANMGYSNVKIVANNCANNGTITETYQTNTAHKPNLVYGATYDHGWNTTINGISFTKAQILAGEANAMLAGNGTYNVGVQSTLALTKNNDGTFTVSVNGK